MFILHFLFALIELILYNIPSKGDFFLEKIFVYPGSFDPVTNGHLDIIDRATAICDKLIVAVLVNSSKNPVFSLEERVQLLRTVLKGRNNIEIEMFEGLLVDFVRLKKSNVIVKGLRVVSDFEFELQMASLNKSLDKDIETIFMMTSVKHSFLSSSAVRELARNKGKIDELVPSCIVDEIYSKFESRLK